VEGKKWDLASVCHADVAHAAAAKRRDDRELESV
jgi:hypothetical protein